MLQQVAEAALQALAELQRKGLGQIPASERIFQFKITLLQIHPPVWRRIQVKDCTLDRLHQHIQQSHGLEERSSPPFHGEWPHLRRSAADAMAHCEKTVDTIEVAHGKERGTDPFCCLAGTPRGPFRQKGSVPFPLRKMPRMLQFFSDGHTNRWRKIFSSPVNSLRTKLSDILPPDGSRFRFEYKYDFGDCWEHEIQFEGRLRAEENRRYPVCVEGERACPPEDVGGPQGYREFWRLWPILITRFGSTGVSFGLGAARNTSTLNRRPKRCANDCRTGVRWNRLERVSASDRRFSPGKISEQVPSPPAVVATVRTCRTR